MAFTNSRVKNGCVTVACKSRDDARRDWIKYMAGYSPFESRIVRLINDDFFSATGQPGLAFRLKQSRWNTQLIDVLVDSGSRAHYLAIECKSIDPKKTRKFYFSAWDRKGRHQVETISEFVDKSQRFGIMAAEIRQGRGPIPNQIFLIPWQHVDDAYQGGKVGIDPNDLPDKYPQLKKIKGTLNLESCLSLLRQF